MPVLNDSDRLTWTVEGQQVLAPYGNKGNAIICTVIKACGDRALVENRKRNFSKWFDCLDLFPYNDQIKERIENSKR